MSLAADRMRGFEERLDAPRTLEFEATERAKLQRAFERARTQLCEELPPVLVTALCGGTGAGKSTLINALAGHGIAEASEERPTTTHVRAYHHRDIPAAGLPSEIAAEARMVAHGREELRFKVLVDTPDLDSFVREHRARTRRLLRASGLVLYVFSPEKYLEERLWSVLREERQFSASAVVLNKCDTLSASELEKVSEDLAQRLESVGLGGARIFRTCAARHVGSPDPGIADPALDETEDLRRFLEQELREGDATRLVREQRHRALDGLRRELETAAPRGLLDRLDGVEAELGLRAEEAGSRLCELLGEELSAVENELSPLITLRQHERFHGPFRAWLSITDFLTIGLRGLVDRLLGHPPRGTVDVVERILNHSRRREVESLLRAEERALQDRLYSADLPVGRWRQIAGETEGDHLVAALAKDLRGRFEARAALIQNEGGSIVFAVSTIGALVPSGVVLVGLWMLLRDLWQGAYGGLMIFLHLAATVLLFFLTLQGLVSVLLSGSRGRGRGVGLDSAREVLPQLLGRWVREYREELSADLDDLHGPLDKLEANLEDPDGSWNDRESFGADARADGSRIDGPPEDAERSFALPVEVVDTAESRAGESAPTPTRAEDPVHARIQAALGGGGEAEDERDPAPTHRDETSEDERSVAPPAAQDDPEDRMLRALERPKDPKGHGS